MFAGNYESLAKNNTDFRRVLFTGPKSQIVAMCLKPDEGIGEETHPETDQIFLIADGKGEAVIGEETRWVEEGIVFSVPAGTNHNVTNTGDEDLKLLTIYAPPQHPDGTVHATKTEAMAEEAGVGSPQKNDTRSVW